ncbi:MAG: DUF4476 domain-containing protein [Sphingobacteriales bacterium]|nr:MAG: DUF4476 domain-containing protein [Sphingobacteriales bacterium]
MKKKILQIVLLVALSVSAKADYYTSAINICNHDNDLITVMLDGIQYPNAVTEFHLSGITPGRHQVKVFTRENYGYNYSRFAHLAYSGFVNLKPGEEIFAVIDPYNQLRIKRVVTAMPAPVTVVKPNLSCNTSYNPNNYTPDNCNNNNYSYGPYAMDESSYCTLKQCIADKWFDSSKSEVAQMAMRNNYFTTQQVAGILNLFDFESAKLEFAKMAYSHVVDQQNYWMANDAFSFSSSISSLQEFIGY